MLIHLVSDDSERAAGIQAYLAEHSPGWQLLWTDPADAALSAAREPDVLVCTDGGTPGRGLMLLEQLRSRNPGAALILLMDAGQDQDAMQAMEIAHFVLPEPLDTQALIDAIDSVMALRDLLDDPALKNATSRIGSLPSAPSQYLALTRLLRNPNASNASIVELVASDPAVAAKVLRLTNSAYYSKGRIISDLGAAITHLGHTALRQLVLATEVFSSSANAKRADAMRDRALRTSRLAGQLLQGPGAALATTAGLLAEVGLLLPPMEVGQDGEPLSQSLAGAYLLGMWGLPMPIIEAVAFHPTPIRTRGLFWVTGAVHVAVALVNETAVDEDYLRSVGVLEQLPRWRTLSRGQHDT